MKRNSRDKENPSNQTSSLPDPLPSLSHSTLSQSTRNIPHPRNHDRFRVHDLERGEIGWFVAAGLEGGVVGAGGEFGVEVWRGGRDWFGCGLWFRGWGCGDCGGWCGVQRSGLWVVYQWSRSTGFDWPGQRPTCSSFPMSELGPGAPPPSAAIGCATLTSSKLGAGSN